MKPYGCDKVVQYEGLARYSHGCEKTGKVEVEGNWYCGVHDPIRRAEKDKSRSDKWKRESEVRDAKRNIEMAEKNVLRRIREDAAWPPAEAIYALKLADEALAKLLEVPA